MNYISYLPLLTLIFGDKVCDAFSPRSFRSKSHLSLRDSSSQLFASTDDQNVVIVGGGVAGLATAFYLKKNDEDLQVTLLEKYRSKEEIPNGPTTAYSLGNLPPKGAYSTDTTFTSMMSESIDMFPDWLESFKYRSDLECFDILLPGGDRLLQYGDFKNCMKPLDYVLRMNSLVNQEIKEWAVVPNALKIQPQLLRHDLEKKCIHLGVDVRFETAESLIMNDSSCTGVKVESGAELLGTVVVANGHNFNDMLKDIDVVPIVRVNCSCLSLEIPEDEPDMNVRILSYDAHIVPLPKPNQRIVRCGDSGNFIDRVPDPERTYANLEKLVPGVSKWCVKKNDISQFAATYDNFPIVGKTTKCDNLYLCGGLNGYGVAIAPKCAELVGKLILHNGNGDVFDEKDKKYLNLCNPDREVSNEDDDKYQINTCF